MTMRYESYRRRSTGALEFAFIHGDHRTGYVVRIRDGALSTKPLAERTFERYRRVRSYLRRRRSR